MKDSHLIITNNKPTNQSVNQPNHLPGINQPINKSTNQSSPIQLNPTQPNPTQPPHRQGWRVDMEDSHTIITNVGGLEGHSFVAIYDGHGGALCAAYAGEHMMRHIMETEDFAAYAESTDKDTGVS